MAEDITTQILGVREEPSKDGQSMKQLVSISGGKGASGFDYPAGDYVTFDKALADRAAGHVGAQGATVRLEVKQVPKKKGGGFWNNQNILEVGPAQGGLTPQAQPVQGGTQAQPVQQQEVTAAQQGPAPQVQAAFAAEDQRRSEENRRSAMHAASEYVVGLLNAGLIQHPDAAAQALQHTTEFLVRYITTGNFMPEAQNNVASQHPVETAETPQEIAEAVPGVTVGVPFDTAPAA